jgi:uncharacterized protein YjbI with pentapeptide repeats
MTWMHLVDRWLKRNRRSLWQIGAAVLAVVAVVTILFLLLGPATSWAGGSAVRALSPKDKAAAINGVRQTLLQASAGTVALIVLVFTGLTFALNRRGQVTDRYTKAIGLLASDKPTERIGGIYALEHVMSESRRDHETVVQVLAAFVRERAPIKAARPTLWVYPPLNGSVDRPLSVPAIDVQAALTVLGRRPKRSESQFIDLHGTDLRGAGLSGADFRYADLSGARLANAHMSQIHLENAKLEETDLQHAELYEAHLEHAYLRKAHLEHAVMMNAHLDHAILEEAHLEHVMMRDASLKRAWLSKSYLTYANLYGADLDDVDLREAHLEHAILIKDHLDKARLKDAHLENAHLYDAELGPASLPELYLEHGILGLAHHDPQMSPGRSSETCPTIDLLRRKAEPDTPQSSPDRPPNQTKES